MLQADSLPTELSGKLKVIRESQCQPDCQEHNAGSEHRVILETERWSVNLDANCLIDRKKGRQKQDWMISRLKAAIPSKHPYQNFQN